MRLRSLLLCSVLLAAILAGRPLLAPAPVAIAHALPTLDALTSLTIQQPTHPGLALVPGTYRRDYGDLRPLDIGYTGHPAAYHYPANVDLSRWDMPVGDQGWVGACSAWATTYSLVGWYLTKEHLPGVAMAPMYSYLQADGGKDDGSMSYSNIEADVAGMLPQSLYPQGNYAWAVPPTGWQMALARHWRITGLGIGYLAPATMQDSEYSGPPPPYGQVLTAAREGVELALSTGQPLELDLNVLPSFYDATPQTAWIGPPDPHAKSLGAHAVLAVGYDRSGVWIENQWGTNWGRQGYAELSWDYVAQEVYGGVSITGVTVAPDAAAFLPPLYHGPATLRATVVQGGRPARDQSTWRPGAQLVISGQGFRPGADVRLYFDGVYHQYVTSFSDGTWSLQWYNFDTYGATSHNLRPAAGAHTITATDGRQTIHLRVIAG